MQNELKPCPNCGSENLHHYGLAAEVECNDCTELRSFEEWQADTMRERLLRAENEKLRARCEAYEELISALKTVGVAHKIQRECEGWNPEVAAPYNNIPKCEEAVKDARAKLEALK